MLPHTSSAKLWYVIDTIIIVLLTIVFGWYYGANHAWGSWGDDSPGYIYTAAQLLQGKPLVSQSDLVRNALDYFGNEPWARLAAPTHHDIISPSGWMASRYPIGLSVLLAGVSAVTQSASAMYWVLPVVAVLGLWFTYLLAVFMLPLSPYIKRAVGIIAAITLGLTELYSSYAVSQPMRDIPALTFFLAATVMLYYAVTRITGQWQRLIMIGLAGIVFGYSIDIRETSAVLLLPLILIIIGVMPRGKARRQALLAGAVGLLLASTLWLWNSAMITLHKEKFKAKDITNIAITANFDHVQSLSFENVYNNQGKYKRGVGGVNQYLTVLHDEFAFWPPFLVLAVVGVMALWRQQRHLAYIFISWFGTIFILFSMWINPYARYILPLFPAVTLLGGYGLMAALTWLQQRLQLSRLSWGAISLVLLGSFMVSLQPLAVARTEHIVQQQLVNKAITRQDLQQFQQLGEVIVQQKSIKPPLVVFLGFWQSGSAEMLMANNAQIEAIRYPRKAKEQPPVEQMTGWLKQLSQHYQLYLWYDDTASAPEQALRQQLTLEPLTQVNFSFQPNVQLYAITQVAE